MKYILLLIILGTITQSQAQLPSQKLIKKATKFAQKTLITDGHIDLPYRLKIKNFELTREYLGIPIETDAGDFDYVRSKAGGLDAPFMAIYIPSKLGWDKEAKDLADDLIDMVSGIADAHPDKFSITTSSTEAMQNFKKGLISLPMGMENGSPVGTDLENVKYWYDRGIRYITLTHAKDNQICDSSYDTTGTWGGLSPYGEKVVAEMNKVGIMVDISHVSDNAFYQTMDITKVPAIASHSSCRAFTPQWQRNMSDEMIKRLAENGGVIQINFGSSFLDEEIRLFYDERRTRLYEILRENGFDDDDDPEAKDIVDKFESENPRLFSDVLKVADHIDHVVKLVGVEHVAFGSDFDGVGDSLPTGIKDVSQFPNLIAELMRRGYKKKDLKKICYQNVFRVWEAVEDYAQNAN